LRAELIVRQSEALFSALIDLAPVGIYVVDAKFRLRQVNPRAMPDFKQIKPLIGSDFAKIVRSLWPEKVADSLIKEFRHTLSTGEAFQAPDVSDKRKDTGVRKVYEWSLQRVTLPDGEYGVVCYYNDITERKAEEKAERRLAVLTASHKRLEREIARRQVVEDALNASQTTAQLLLEESQILQADQRRLSHRLLSAEEEERKRISRELHDVIAQALAGINMRLSVLKSNATISTEALQHEIELTQRLVAQSVDTVHRFARDLRPSMLDFLGLVPALEAYAKEFTERTGLPVIITADKHIERLGSTERTVLYRIAQEALTNVDRHAKASAVEISLAQRDGSVCMDIRDDGQGFEVSGNSCAEKPNRLGMLGMKERVEMIGGSFLVESAPGKATTVRVEIPIPS
jgi:PAS domain S-box-containing protein